MSIEFGNTELTELTPRIAVIGVGGAGCNAVNNMIAAQLQGVDFVVANTDAQSLAASKADNRLQLGVQITQGLGAGAQPKVGAAAAEEAVDTIDDMLNGAHMAFVTAGMGGGTGTGAAPVIARRAREKGILTVGVVTKPFQFEGGRRMKIADSGIADLAQHVDTLIIIPNQNLFRVADERTTFADAFNMADEVLHSGVRGITDLMVMPGLINLDFADVRTVMSEMGKAMMGTGEADGENRAQDAAAAAISNPLLEEASLKGAKGVIINVTGGMDMTLYEVDEAVNMVREQADEDALIVFGSAFNPELEGKLRVSVVATGIEGGAATIDIPQPVRTPVQEPVKSEAEEKADAPVAEAPQAEALHYETPQAQEVEEKPEDVLSEIAAAVEDKGEAEDVALADAAEEVKADALTQPEAVAQPVEEPTSDAAVDLESKAVEASGNDLFVSDAPMMPKASTEPTMAPAAPEQVESYVSSREETEVSPETVEVEETPQKRSLFQVMTAGLRSSEPTEPVQAKPASNDLGNTGLGGLSKEDRPAAPSAETKDQLEIPSFLRRQNNP